MSKIILDNVVSGYDLSKINSNFQKIADTLNQLVLFRNNPIGEINQLETSIDANNNTIYNVLTPTQNTHVANKKYVDDVVTPGLSPLVIEAQTQANLASTSATQAASSATAAASSASQAQTYQTTASTYATNASISANSAATSASTASQYSSLGLGAAGAFDFGSVIDSFISFPTDFGLII